MQQLHSDSFTVYFQLGQSHKTKEDVSGLSFNSQQGQALFQWQTLQSNQSNFFTSIGDVGMVICFLKGFNLRNPFFFLVKLHLKFCCFFFLTFRMWVS